MRSFTAIFTAAAIFAASNSRAAFNADIDKTAEAIAETIVQFQNQGLIPSPVPSEAFQPTAALTLTYPKTGVVALGQRVSADAVSSTPSWSLDIPASQAATFQNKLFTAIVADPGAPSSNYSGLVVRHALVNNLTLSSDGTLKNTSAFVENYMGPAPPAGSGPHRYMTLIVAQPSGFSAPANLSQPNTPLITNWTLSQYLSQANLGPIVAASYFIVQNGKTTASSVTTVPDLNTASISATAAALETKFSTSTAAASTTSGASPSSSGNKGAGFANVQLSGVSSVLGISAGAALAGAVALLL
ncbi:hypothetical protein OC845_003178 [Tilletia horrida]|nr:hypothetical protein OC845_003178 [Tilletia horrida]